MSNKKKIFSIVITLIMIFTLYSVCFATEDQVITPIESGDNYIDNYDDYEDYLQQTSDTYSQDELKAAYDAYQESLKEYYNEYKRDGVIKARVVEIEDVKTVYELDEYYYSVNKYEIQPIVVHVLEGEHEGERFSINYLLTGDSLNNIQYSKVSVGDTIFIGFYEDETTGEVVADITNTGSNVERLGIVICILAVVVILLIIYAGKNGILVSLLGILISIFCLGILPNMGYEGKGFIVGGIFFVIALIYLITIVELKDLSKEEDKKARLKAIGLERTRIIAIGISLLMTVVSTVLIIATNYMTRTVGAGFEFSALSENVLLANMNFEELFIVITTMISAIVATHMVCKTIKKLETMPAEADFNEKLTNCKELLSSSLLIIIVTILALYIPNHLLLLTNKYTSREIWNSEILASELVRMFVILIIMILSVPTTVALYKKSKSNYVQQ